MKYARVHRVHVPYEPPFDPERTLYAAGEISLREIMEVDFKYRQRLLLCFDPSVGERHASTYHKQPPELDRAKLVPFYRDVLDYVLAHDHEPLYGFEIGNEMDYTAGWLPKGSPWSEVSEFYWQYNLAYQAVRKMIRDRTADYSFPVIVGGANPWYWRNVDGGHPSLSRWMIEEDYAHQVAWHPGERWTPEQIERATRQLRGTGAKVYVTEDVYYQEPNAHYRASAAYAGGAELWCGWSGWLPEPGWGSGEGVACEWEGKWDAAREHEFRQASEAIGRLRDGLKPRDVPEPSPGPDPEPVDYEPLARAEYDLAWHQVTRGGFVPATDVRGGEAWEIAMIPWPNLSDEDREALIKKTRKAEEARRALDREAGQ